MKKEKILRRLLDEKIISIVRLKNGEMTSRVINHLIQGGIKVLEVTSNTPNFDVEISKAREKYPDVLIGAGTITTPELASKAIDAGAQFLVTPNTNKLVVEMANKAEIPVAMGALTPTEIANAIDFGADIIKLFPANQFGAPYFKSLKGPFSNINFFAVGGIGIDNMGDWFTAGIDGVGIGSTLVKSEINTEEELDAITISASRFVERLKN
ncbi:bifunctional 4-hydroxy-2-oxoglutarate aldolase/2-dehydro-3-deoxy-phosphogluconate aldolase [Muricauda sp. CAU 1633]|uniref:bifunctional 4-hydroxy-2-oxoglutarate aldolase/2-dehydro-3-deoxy-phosphogluconate aldolase n=1 Tax=Allomuricauda sp. CAU 1633 TaxID=2816036 RepID=UPI001A8C1E43|nr:bifunctional 4-hydroxy-2-oxoglutarate aldolase/2-dehydro-3-deoxy-phosphogluconate aldolase [Muricauda sp. CAU 1633]MBO0324129.1 bifunctional 4-hydroxy-2-oxoglutarate aldolase/2-dehydro-3-deoxy-phosphogluconate aldolase [Muricauda sp. CAU 1633]